VDQCKPLTGGTCVSTSGGDGGDGGSGVRSGDSVPCCVWAPEAWAGAYIALAAGAYTRPLFSLT